MIQRQLDSFPFDFFLFIIHISHQFLSLYTLPSPSPYTIFLVLLSSIVIDHRRWLRIRNESLSRFKATETKKRAECGTLAFHSFQSSTSFPCYQMNIVKFIRVHIESIKRETDYGVNTKEGLILNIVYVSICVYICIDGDDEKRGEFVDWGSREALQFDK